MKPSDRIAEIHQQLMKSVDYKLCTDAELEIIDIQNQIDAIINFLDKSSQVEPQS